MADLIVAATSREGPSLTVADVLDWAWDARERLPAEVGAVMYDEAGNHVLDIPIGTSRDDLAARWLEIAG